MSLGDRAERLDASLAEVSVDFLLVSSLVNIQYLCGFEGTNGICIIGQGKRIFVTDFRYVELAERELEGWDVRRGARDLIEVALDDLSAEQAPRLGFDDTDLTVKQHARLEELVAGKCELVPANGLVEQLREVKDEREIASIAAAAQLADELYRWVTEAHGLAGHTESAVAKALEVRALELGSKMSFPPIVASGPNGALPHAMPGEAVIEQDTLVVVDMGCVLDAYCSDCTRTFATGELSSGQREIYDLVVSAQLASLDAVRPGASGEAVDAAAREPIDGAGFAKQFGHGTGHGVGLEVHEGPRVAPKAEGVLMAGNVITVEPGVYVPGSFGVRIEDLVVVRDDGPEILTQIPKALTVV